MCEVYTRMIFESCNVTGQDIKTFSTSSCITWSSALWRHDAPKIKGYDETVNWTFDDWKNMSGHWDGQDTFRIFLSTEIVTSPRMSTNWPQTAEHGAYSLQMDMLRYSTRSHCNIHVHSSIRSERTENKSIHIDIVTNARCITWVWFATRAKARTGNFGTQPMQSYYDDSILTNCLVSGQKKTTRCTSRVSVLEWKTWTKGSSSYSKRSSRNKVACNLSSS